MHQRIDVPDLCLYVAPEETRGPAEEILYALTTMYATRNAAAFTVSRVERHAATRFKSIRSRGVESSLL